MRLVIVDDESLIRMDLREFLEGEGHEVLGEGKDGVEAIQLAKTLHPDVILMDVNMPNLDGIEAARQIRHGQLAPVVLLTAYSQEDLVKKAKESGVYGYLLKPLRTTELIPTLLMAIGRFEDEQRMASEVKRLEQTLEERKLIAKAVGILMDAHGLSEDDAYQRIRSYSMKHKQTIVETCKKILEAHDKK